MLDDTTQNLPAMRLRLSDVVAEYDAKAEARDLAAALLRMADKAEGMQ